MAIKISEISQTASGLLKDTWVEVSEEDGGVYTTKRYNLKEIYKLATMGGIPI